MHSSNVDNDDMFEQMQSEAAHKPAKGKAPDPLDAANCSAGFGQTLSLSMDDVIIALQNIGLGSKLVNAALTEMGYALISFPEQND
jgi:hypothetical protein